MRIEVKNLTYSYAPSAPKAHWALKGIDLTIEEGDFFGIIGHTGSGKSTFVQHLNAIIRLPSSQKKYKPKKLKKGELPPVLPSIHVGEYDLGSKETDFKQLRSKVGIVFQYPEYQLFAQTVEEDVAFGLKNFSKTPLTKEEIDEKVRDALEAVGLDYERVRLSSPFALSGGQQRRVAIAGVIVSRPEILVLDEPAAGLDPLGKREIMDLLHNLHESWCRTVIIVSHDMDEICENCNRVAVFADGELRFVLPPSELFLKWDELTAMSLDVSTTAKVCRALEERGIRIDTDFTSDDFVRQVLARAGAESAGEDGRKDE